MECRVSAEDPDNHFLPSPGRIEQMREPSGPGVRLDSGVYPGWTVPLEYDALLAKLIAWAPDREGVVQRMARSLSEYAITGVKTNVGFCHEIMEDAEFRAGNLSTEFIPDFFARRSPQPESADLDLAVALAAVAHFQTARARKMEGSRIDASRWLSEGRSQLLA